MRYRTSRLHRRREAPADCACRHSSGTPPSRSSSACTDTEGGLLMDMLPGWCQEAQKRADPHRLHPCAVGRQSPCGQPRSSGAPQGCTGGKAGRQVRVTAGVQHMVSNSNSAEVLASHCCHHRPTGSAKTACRCTQNGRTWLAGACGQSRVRLVAVAGCRHCHVCMRVMHPVERGQSRLSL